MIRTRRLAMGLACAGMIASPALAAAPDAWEAFSKEVETACLEAARPLFAAAVADVDPFGSESYGLALVHGKAKGADADIRAICVFDKRTKEVQIGGELPAPK